MAPGRTMRSDGEALACLTTVWARAGRTHCARAHIQCISPPRRLNRGYVRKRTEWTRAKAYGVCVSGMSFIGVADFQAAECRPSHDTNIQKDST